MKPPVLVTVTFLSLVAVLHLARLVFGVEITVDVLIIPMWASVIACVGPGALAIWLWRSQQPARQPGQSKG